MKLKKLWLIAPAVLGIAIVPTIMASCAGLEQKTEGTLTPPPSTDDNNNGNTTTPPTNSETPSEPSGPNEANKIKTFEIFYTNDGVEQKINGCVYIRGYESKEELINFISKNHGEWINFEKLSLENHTFYREIYRAKWMADNFKLDSIREMPYREWVIF